MDDQVFKLFITQDSETSRTAIAYLKKYINSLRNPNVYLEVIDITTNLEMAFAEKIFTTPTLIWKSGGRKLRFIGEISDLDQYLA